LTILIISYIRFAACALKRAPAAVIFAPFSAPNAHSEKPVDLDFYTG